METNERTSERPESEEIKLERATRHARKLAKKYREQMIEDLESAPFNKRLLCGTLAMEYLDLATDLFALAAIRAAAESGSVAGTVLKLKEVLTAGVDRFSAASEQMLLIALRNCIKSGVLESPGPVSDALVEALNEYIDTREKIWMKDEFNN